MFVPNYKLLLFTPVIPKNSEGSKLVSVTLDGDDESGIGIRRQRSSSRGGRGREPVLRVSNTIAACNYLARNSATSNKKSFINSRQSNGARKSWFSKKAKNVVNHTPVPPSIVISEDRNNTSENAESRPGKDERSKRRDSFGTIALKVTEKSIGKERRKSHDDMSHIRAKWLLGFNLTMVRQIFWNIGLEQNIFDKKCRSMSSEMLSQHVQQMAHMKKKTKEDLDPLYDVKKKEQVSFGFTFHQLFIVCK